MGYMSHWVGVSKGLCEINWKNVTHLVQGPLLFHHRVPTGKFLSRKTQLRFSDMHLLYQFGRLKLFVS